MKQKVVHLTAETRRCVIRLYHALDVLLVHDDSSTGLSGRYAFLSVRPYLFQMFSHLWGKDDCSLTKIVSVEFPDVHNSRVKRVELPSPSDDPVHHDDCPF